MIERERERERERGGGVKKNVKDRKSGGEKEGGEGIGEVTERRKS